MRPTTQRRVATLAKMTVAEFRERYAEVFGEETRSRHKVFLPKRIAWGLHLRDEGRGEDAVVTG